MRHRRLGGHLCRRNLPGAAGIQPLGAYQGSIGLYRADLGGFQRIHGHGPGDRADTRDTSAGELLTRYVLIFLIGIIYACK